MGYYDLPADITYVLNITKQETMYYAGHSMGTAMLMVLFTTRPQFQDKIEIAFALAPAVFVEHSKSIIFTYFCQYFSASTCFLKLQKTTFKVVKTCRSPGAFRYY